jgi:hypothetical protein
VALQENYDVAVVVSGDADSIPSIRHLKSRNKHIAAVEFINGSPPETKGRTFSSRLKEHADFVIRIYETELVRLKLARRPPSKTRVGAWLSNNNSTSTAQLCVCVGRLRMLFVLAQHTGTFTLAPRDG